MRLLLDLRLVLAKGVRMAAGGLLLQLCHLLFLTVGALGSMEHHKLLSPEAPAQPSKGQALGPLRGEGGSQLLRNSALEHLHLGRKIGLLCSYHLSYHRAGSLTRCCWWSCSIGFLGYGLCRWFCRLRMVLIHCYSKPWQNSGVLQPVSFGLWTQVDLKLKKKSC